MTGRGYRNTSQASMRLSLTLSIVLLWAAGSLGFEAAVEVVLPNGTKTVIAEEEDAIDITDAAARALPEDDTELKSLLNWAISELSCSPARTPLQRSFVLHKKGASLVATLSSTREHLMPP